MKRGGVEYVWEAGAWRPESWARFNYPAVDFWVVPRQTWCTFSSGVQYYLDDPPFAIGTPLFCRLFGFEYKEPQV